MGCQMEGQALFIHMDVLEVSGKHKYDHSMPYKEHYGGLTAHKDSEVSIFRAIPSAKASQQQEKE